MLGKLLKPFHLLASKPKSEMALHIGLQSICLVETSASGTFSVSYGSLKEEPSHLVLAQLLKSVKKGCRLHLVLNPELYQLVQIDKPTLPESDMQQALPWQVKDLVTVAAEDMVADYIDAPETAGQSAKINVVVASISALKPLVNVIAHAGMELSSIQPEEWLASFLMPPQPHAAMLVIKQPEQEMLIQIVKDGVLYFSRRTRGFSRMQFDNDTQWQNDWLDRLQLELQRSMDYFESQLKQAPVRDIGLLMPNAPQVAEMLNSAGFSRVNTITPASISQHCTDAELLQCWSAIAVLNQSARDNAA